MTANPIKGEEQMEVEIKEEDLKEIQLPPRQKALLRFKAASKVPVRTNCYKIEFKDTVFHRYEARFFFKNDYREVDLSEKVKDSRNPEGRRELLSKLFGILWRGHPEIFNQKDRYVFDSSCTLISTGQLAIPSEKIDIDPESLKPEVRANLPRKINELYVVLKFIGEIQLDSASINRSDELELRDRSPLQVLEWIFNQSIISSNEFHIIDRKSFLKEAGEGREYPIIQGRIIKDGLEKGVRPCGDEKDQGLMLQVDVRKAPFFPDCPLADYLKKWYDIRQTEDLKNKFRSASELNKVSKELKGLTLMTTHLKKNRIFRCSGLDDRSAQDRTFSVDDKNGGDGGEPDSKKSKKECSVYEYYQQKYRNIQIVYSKYPCVLEKTFERGTRNKVLNFYPFDVLQVVAGQKVPLTKMNKDFQEAMIKQAAMKPPELIKTTEHLTYRASLNASNPYAEKFGCKMETKPIHLEAEVLYPPSLKFGGTTKGDYVNGKLSLSTFKYLVSGKCKNWVFVNYQRCVDDKVANGFIQELKKRLSEHGTNIEDPKYTSDAKTKEDIFNFGKKHNAEYIMFVTSNPDGDYLHGIMKHYEITSGVVTQHLRESTVKKAAGQRNTLGNIVMKSNEKIGGMNYLITTGKDFTSANRQQISRISPQLIEHWLGSNRLFIGINFSHTSGTSFRTAVGIVYNYDQSHKITGFPFYIESGTTIIHSLETHFIKPILDFKNRSKGSVWPSHLMIYRGGLSEGDYLHALKIEKSAIRNLLNKLRTEHKAPQIGFTIITVQRQHKFRIVPVQGEKNLPIGTTITQSIVDPKKEQWITLSHASFQGLPKPSVYTVIADESPSKKRIPSEELINLSYDLCYNHGSILSPVSSPSYMYWAGQVAKRGANNLSVAAEQDPKLLELPLEELNKTMEVKLQNKYFS